MKKWIAWMMTLCLLLGAGALAEEAAHSDTLVVYFSATGITRGVAEKLASVTGADLYEIIPAEPYTDENLNYNDRSTRATREQDNPETRPEIKGLAPVKVAGEAAPQNAESGQADGPDALLQDGDFDLTGYTTVYIGYPIWWGEEPRIMCTFVESHDFTGMTVIPFCTSGGSGIGRSGDDLAKLAGTGTWLKGARHSGTISEDELLAWVNGLK